MQTRSFTVGDTEVDTVIVELLSHTSQLQAIGRMSHGTDAEHEIIDRKVLILADVIRQIKEPSPAGVDVLGQVIPVAAWQEFGIRLENQSFSVWSTTLGKSLDTGLSIFEAVETRDQLIRMYASNRWKEL